MSITAPVSSSTTTEPRLSPSAREPSSTMNEVGDQVAPEKYKKEIRQKSKAIAIYDSIYEAFQE